MTEADNSVRSSPPLSQSLRIITVAGCLAMVYYTCVTCPVVTDYCRDLGATDFDFGLLAGVPMVMLFMQFVGAYLTDRVRRRKPYFMVIEISARLVWVPAAFLPYLFPGLPDRALVWVFIGFCTFNGLLSNMTGPLWFSWMSDLVPRRVLNRYWGYRQRYMTLVWALAYLGVAAFVFYGRVIPVRQAFPVIVCFGVLAGIMDILLFWRVGEPENLMNPDVHPVEVLLAPLRHPEYRSLVVFSCAFSAAAMLGAAFMQVYVLKALHIEVWKTTLIWCSAGLGGALIAPVWGRIADEHGHRPVLLLCVIGKPLICLVFLFATADNAFVLLSVSFFLDSMMNGGYSIAVNGFMLKSAPRASRSMFIAAMTALSGLAAGLGSIAGGAILKGTEGMQVALAGWTFTNYHLVFAISFVLRVLCIPLAAAVREPTSAHTVVVINSLLGWWPLRILAFPIGLYRRFLSAEEEEEALGRRPGPGDDD